MPEYSDEAFVKFVDDLHTAKHEVYGDSWKRRGEQVAILANIARKVDRLGVAGAGDTSADTAVDLLVYLLKYRLWLSDNIAGEKLPGSREGEIIGDGPGPVRDCLLLLEGKHDTQDVTSLIRYDKEVFEQLLQRVEMNAPRSIIVNGMIVITNELARVLWALEL